MTCEPLLIVDDNAVNLRLTRALLASEGYAARMASTAEEAWRMIRASRPRLVLIDIQLPDADGFTLAERIKADPGTRDVAVVAMTAYDQREYRARAEASGCAAYLTKPIDRRQLLREVARHVSGPRSWENQRPAGAVVGKSPAAPAVRSSPSLDPTCLARLERIEARAGPGFVEDILGTFLTAASQTIRELRAAAEQNDEAALEQLCHRLAGGCRDIGAKRMELLCRHIGGSLDRGRAPRTLARLVSQLEQEYHSLRSELEGMSKT